MEGSFIMPNSKEEYKQHMVEQVESYIQNQDWVLIQRSDKSWQWCRLQ